jgi:hypothetical protein
MSIRVVLTGNSNPTGNTIRAGNPTFSSPIKHRSTMLRVEPQIDPAILTCLNREKYFKGFVCLFVCLFVDKAWYEATIQRADLGNIMYFMM